VVALASMAVAVWAWDWVFAAQRAFPCSSIAAKEQGLSWPNPEVELEELVDLAEEEELWPLPRYWRIRWPIAVAAFRQEIASWPSTRCTVWMRRP